MKRKRFLCGNDEVTASMHPLNPYHNHKPDFAILAEKYPDLLGGSLITHPNGTVSLDWNDSNSQRSLTAALLRHDFGINFFELPADKLCPPVPNRVNYVCWVHDLISLSSHTLVNSPDIKDNVRGSSSAHPRPHVLDIGVGAGCIYPLLGHKLFGWRCLGSDVDASSVQSSQHIVKSNGLSSSIEVVCVTPCEELQAALVNKITSTLAVPLTQLLDTEQMPTSHRKGPIILALEASSGWQESTAEGDSQNDLLLDACMTNPPFYDVDEEVQSSEHAACTGSRAEMHTLGGEVAFVSAMLLDSQVLTTRVRWYSTMLGKKQSLRALLRLLRSQGVTNVRSTRFVQGAATVRWGLAWSFWPEGAGDVAASKVFGDKKKGGRGEGAVMRDVAVMSVNEMVKTSLITELQSASIDAGAGGASAGASAGAGAGAGAGSMVLRDCASLEGYLRSRGVAQDRGEQCCSASSCAHRHFHSFLAAKSDDETGLAPGSCDYDDESRARLTTVELICLCLDRISTVLSGLRSDTDEGSWCVDTAGIDTLSWSSVVVPLQRPGGSGVAGGCGERYTAQVTVSSERDEVRLCLCVEVLVLVAPGGQQDQHVPPAIRSIFFKFADSFEAEWLRRNRRWRRVLAATAAEGTPSDGSSANTSGKSGETTRAS